MKFLRLLNRDEPTSGAIAALADAPEDHPIAPKPLGRCERLFY